jgi:hypothetical protein
MPDPWLLDDKKSTFGGECVLDGLAAPACVVIFSDSTKSAAALTIFKHFGLTLSFAAVLLIPMTLNFEKETFLKWPLLRFQENTSNNRCRVR